MSENPNPTTLYPNQTSSLATISLVSGILGWTILPTIGGIVAVITGHMAKGEIRRSAGALSGDGLATAGLVLGYLNLVASLAGICLVAAIIAGLISAPFLCLPFSNEIQIQAILPLIGG